MDALASGPIQAPSAEGIEGLRGADLGRVYASLCCELAHGAHALARFGRSIPLPDGSDGAARAARRIHDWDLGAVLGFALSPEETRAAVQDMLQVFPRPAAGLPPPLIERMRSPLLTLATDCFRRDPGLLRRVEQDVGAMRVLAPGLAREFAARAALGQDPAGSPGCGAAGRVPAEHSLVVLGAIGDAASSEGQNAAARFGALLAPLPLRAVAPDPDLVWEVLQGEFPWMAEANLHLASAAATARLGGRAFRAPPLLLVGAPGCGKTRWACRAAGLLGLGHAWLSMSGMSTSMAVCGNERGWRDARPCFAASAIAARGTANPLLLLDEVDKAAQGGHNGDPVLALLPLLEEGTASRVPDNYLLGDLDLGWVSWVLTANEERAIPAPLLDRLAVARVHGPDPSLLGGIVARMAAEYAARQGIPPDSLPALDDALPRLRRAYEASFSLRDLGKEVAAEIARRLWSPRGYDPVAARASREVRVGFRPR